MADARIPLNITQVDVGPSLAIRNQLQQQGLQNERVQRIDQLNADQHAQSMETGLLQQDRLRQQLAQVDPAVLKDVMRQIAVNSNSVETLLKNGDAQTATLLARSTRELMTGVHMPTESVDNLITLIGTNPQAATQWLGQQNQSMAQYLPEMFKDEVNEQGQIVGQRNQRTNELSAAPDAMGPQQAALQQLELQNQQLTNQRLTGQIQNDQQAAQIQAQQAEVKQTENEQRQLAIQTEAQRAYDLAGTMLNSGALESATGPISSRIPTTRPATADFEANLKELENLLTLGNLGRMTGVLSESDIKILANAASGLSIGGSEERMREKLEAIRERLSANPAVQAGSQDVGGRGTVGRFQIEVIE